jgi:glycosyltransferase involved in cell wall biosynthesis
VRVLLVNDYQEAGGCEVLVHLLQSGLSDRGHEVRLFTSDDVPGHRRTALGYVSSRSCRRAIRGVLSAFEPQVVHLHNFYHELSPGILVEVGRWKREDDARRALMTAHDFHLVCPNSGGQHFRRGRPVTASVDDLRGVGTLLRRRWDHRGLCHSILKLAQHVWNYRWHDRRRVLDRVICPSRLMQSMLQPFGLPTVHLPNPAPSAPLTRPARSQSGLTLVCAGRLEAEKGVVEFLGALPDDVSWRLEIVGDGAAAEACRTIVAQRALTDRVTFSGHLPHDEALQRIAGAHVLALPSRCPENAPQALIEALASGTNLLVADGGGGREIVEEAGVGTVYDPEDDASLAAALAKIHDAHETGGLNQFDVIDFLAARDEESFFTRLETIYAAPTAACDAAISGEPCAS